MDVIFDIDGTLANAEHRLHFITDPDKAKDWENFLSDEQVANDAPIDQIWTVLHALASARHKILFITGRPARQRKLTIDWLMPIALVELERKMPSRRPHPRILLAQYWADRSTHKHLPRLYMRADGDRRPSHIVKQELLYQARSDGFAPKIVFEDRKDDAAMWRKQGLICCQVAEGDY